MERDWLKVYDLKKDNEYIELVQQATLRRNDAGLKTEYGLFGSDEWWNAVDKGFIQKIQVEGKITNINMGGHNDFPEFELTTDNNEKTSWARRGADDFFKIGKRAKIIYVMQKFKKPLPKLPKESEIILQMWCEK